MGLSRRRTALLGRLRSRRTREREGLYLVEGLRSVTEALDSRVEVRFAICSPRVRTLEGGNDVVTRMGAAGLDLEWVDDDDLAGLADTEAPQGVLLVCAEPSWTLDDLDVPPAGRARVLVVDAVQDPGNLGTLVRAAAAFGLSGVVTLEGTVDPYNPKAVRAAAGGLFHARVVGATWAGVAAWLDREELPLLGAAAGGEDVGTVDAGPRWALAVGNEGRGLRPEVRRTAVRTVAVPMEGHAESLNAGVAGAILIYALGRRMGGSRPGASGTDPNVEPEVSR